MALQFKNYPKGSVVGSGSYVFRHFGSEGIAVVLDAFKLQTVYGSYYPYSLTTDHDPKE